MLGSKEVFRQVSPRKSLFGGGLNSWPRPALGVYRRPFPKSPLQAGLLIPGFINLENPGASVVLVLRVFRFLNFGNPRGRGEL